MFQLLFTSVTKYLGCLGTDIYDNDEEMRTPQTGGSSGSSARVGVCEQRPTRLHQSETKNLAVERTD